MPKALIQESSVKKSNATKSNAKKSSSLDARITKTPPVRQSLLTVDSFFKNAKVMRAHFEERFGDPRRSDRGRFVWDYWNVPDQYTALRTPAFEFFPEKMYDAFHQHLVWWGRRNLGCHDISPTWMSCYIDGCHQQFHGDLPHGPWAFVFSLTPWQNREFSGGETMLLREEILSYWTQFSSGKALEKQDVVQEVPALFNRLTVFDPRIPHGVREVRGPRDVLKGRLVIHGWFVQPRPFIEGSLPTKHLQAAINGLSEELQKLFNEGLDVTGVLSLHFQVSIAGKVRIPKVLSNSVRHPRGDAAIEMALIQHICSYLTSITFGKQKGPSSVTLPLVFEVSAETP